MLSCPGVCVVVYEKEKRFHSVRVTKYFFLRTVNFNFGIFFRATSPPANVDFPYVRAPSSASPQWERVRDGLGCCGLGVCRPQVGNGWGFAPEAQGACWVPVYSVTVQLFPLLAFTVPSFPIRVTFRCQCVALFFSTTLHFISFTSLVYSVFIFSSLPIDISLT